MTLRTVRPATINNTKLWAMLCVGLGLAVLLVKAGDYPSVSSVQMASRNSLAWFALGMGTLLGGMALLSLEGRRSRRLAQVYPASNLLVMPIPRERAPSKLTKGTSDNGHF